ncbi:hypothetical protein WR25_00608 [Diploscapter pachys]|uniref:Anaphase-promoting complex subunit 4 WD40 domain-containing protein n=1 Tax=Diploscapter pachys TaxID=2018661 RepID=A0A2A2KI84_9BILA|nr:hypothetical protein WR25_00608 [Diploscapter pachys]
MTHLDLKLEERSDVSRQGQSTQSMVVHKQTGKLFVARKGRNDEPNDTIEQLNILSLPIVVPERVISPNNGRIESMHCVGNRLVCTHLNGAISIVDIHSASVKRVQICPSPLWECCPFQSDSVCLVSNSDLLYIYDCKAGLVTKSISLGIDKRLFSVAAQGNTIAVGANDCITIIQDGRIKHTLKLERKEKRFPIIVWCLSFCKNNILVSGDSRGNVSFWNTQNGALIKSLIALQADVLSLCATSENVVVCAGVDPSITYVKQVSNDYTIVNVKRGPKRDVKAIVEFDGSMIVGGEDHDLFYCRAYCTPINLQYSKYSLVSEKLTATRGWNQLDIWYNGGVEKKALDEEWIPSEAPSYLARIYSGKKLPITSCDLSSSGDVLVISTSEETCSYKLNPTSKKISKPTTTILKSASALKIIEKSTAVLMCTDDFKLIKFELTGRDSEGDGESLILEQTGCGIVTQLCVSSDEQQAAVLTTRLQVFLISLKRDDSHLIRVNLPIDLCFIQSNLAVLSGFETNKEPTGVAKILNVFGPSGGSPIHSAPSSLLFDSPDRPVSISSNHKHLLVASKNGSFVVFDQDLETIYGPFGAFAAAERIPSSVSLRPFVTTSSGKDSASSRAVALFLGPLEGPNLAPFKLHKFGQQ